MFCISLQNIQHIATLNFSFDLNRHGILAIVGKNGVGKTTLARAIKNISQANSFASTAGPDIFSASSKITYEIDGISRVFIFDEKIGSLNCRQSIPPTWRTDFAVELSIPDGDRFNFFKSLSESDLEIRRALALDEFKQPTELISLLQTIYPGSDYSQLVEVKVRKAVYYCILKSNGRYIREDYLSSGEYFLINIYKRISFKNKFIFVDEIDISLDASAQIRLLDELRRLCTTYNSNVIFTTHSLAMIRLLKPSELLYFSLTNGDAELKESTYGYVNSLLYGFKGWDRYILTEDDVLKEFLEYVIRQFCRNIFSTYLVIYVGGSGNVTDMLRQNKDQQFLAQQEHVIAVLDGDQKNTRTGRHENTLCIPLASVEKALYDEYIKDTFHHRLEEELFSSSGRSCEKILFKALQDRKLMSRTEIYAYLCKQNTVEIENFTSQICHFLNYGN